MQNTMGTFSEARYYLNVNSMVIVDHHSSIIAAAMGLETVLPSKNSGYQKQCIKNKHSTLKPCRLRHDLPFIERTMDVTEGLDEVVGEGSGIF